MCAGISAMMGEACAAGADIPFLVTAETGMFAALAGTLNAPWVLLCFTGQNTCLLLG